MYQYSDFKWKKDKLFCRGEDTGVSYIQELVDGELEGQKSWIPVYKIQYKDGTKSVDYYNKARVMDNAIKTILHDLNSGESSIEAPYSSYL